MKRLFAIVLVACGPSAPPSAPSAPASDPSAASAQPPKEEAKAPATPAKPREETIEDAAKAFFDAALAGDRKAVRARTMSFDEMAEISKKATDRAAYDVDVNDAIERLCQELSNKNVKVVDIKVARRRTATVAENGEKVKRDVELAWIVVTLERDGQRHEAPAFTFVRTGASWKFTTKSS